MNLDHKSSRWGHGISPLYELRSFTISGRDLSESVGLALHGFDLVVGAFQGAGGDWVVVPGKDAEGVEAERLGEGFELADATNLGIGDP